MGAVVEVMPGQTGWAVAMDIRDKVASLEMKLETSVTTLTLQHGHMVEMMARMEANAAKSTEIAAQERKELLAKVTAMEITVAKVTDDLKEITDRTWMAWLRKNGSALGILLTILVTTVAVIKWLIVNYHPVK